MRRQSFCWNRRILSLSLPTCNKSWFSHWPPSYIQFWLVIFYLILWFLIPALILNVFHCIHIFRADWILNECIVIAQMPFFILFLKSSHIFNDFVCDRYYLRDFWNKMAMMEVVDGFKMLLAKQLPQLISICFFVHSFSTRILLCH